MNKLLKYFKWPFLYLSNGRYAVFEGSTGSWYVVHTWFTIWVSDLSGRWTKTDAVNRARRFNREIYGD